MDKFQLGESLFFISRHRFDLIGLEEVDALRRAEPHVVVPLGERHLEDARASGTESLTSLEFDHYHTSDSDLIISLGTTGFATVISYEMNAGLGLRGFLWCGEIERDVHVAIIPDTKPPPRLGRWWFCKRRAIGLPG